jgi:hypothetical protein
MALPASGPISLKDIQAEFGGPSSSIGLGAYYKNGSYVTATSYAPHVPTSGPIAVSDFYGARKLSFYTNTYTSDTSFVLPSSFWGTLEISNMLGGGGGGGGGPDRFGSGYPGYPGYIINGSISANPGDTVTIYVGQPGQPGYDGNNAAGGAGGASNTSWSTLNMVGSPNIIRVTNGAYVGFLNQYGVWNYSSDYPNFDQTVTVNFPFNGYYNILGSCDNYAQVLVDGGQVLSIPEDGYTGIYSNTFYTSAGNHSVRLIGVNTGGPGSFGVTISSGFNGARGGNSGGAGVSGSGGGGGGATALLINGIPAVVAGGGGGGGGAGQYSSGIPNNGIGGNSTFYFGSQGQDKGGDGGGGGGGAGGYYGGLGGPTYGGDDGAYSGQSGGSLLPAGASLTTGNNGGPQNTAGTGGIVTVSYYA